MLLSKSFQYKHTVAQRPDSNIGGTTLCAWAGGYG